MLGLLSSHLLRDQRPLLERRHPAKVKSSRFGRLIPFSLPTMNTVMGMVLESSMESFFP